MSTYGPITASGTVTSYIPMPSWSVPVECATLFLDPWSATASTAPGGLFVYAPEYANVVGAGSPTCLPSAVSLWWHQSKTDETAATTLLGGYTMVCPDAYTTAYHSSQNTLTTTIGCCPLSYSFKPDSNSLYEAGIPGQCYSTLPAGIVTYVQPNAAKDTFTTTSYSIPTTTTVWAVQVNGYIFRTDAAETPSPSSTSSGIPDPTNTTAPPSKLSPGIMAGIGVSISIGVIGLVCLCVAVFLLRRKRKEQAGPPGYPSSSYYGYHEGIEVSERDQLHELSARKPRSELEGSSRSLLADPSGS